MTERASDRPIRWNGLIQQWIGREAAGHRADARKIRVETEEIDAAGICDGERQIFAGGEPVDPAERIVGTVGLPVRVYGVAERDLPVNERRVLGRSARIAENVVACDTTSRCRLSLRGIEGQEGTRQEQERDEDTQRPIATTCSIAASVAVRLRNTPFPTHKILANSGQKFPDPAERMLSRLFRFCCWD